MYVRSCDYCGANAYGREKMIHKIICPLKVVSEEKIGLDFKLSYKCGTLVSCIWSIIVIIGWIIYLCIAIPIWLVLFMLGRVH